jgi:hypothetical protein
LHRFKSRVDFLGVLSCFANTHIQNHFFKRCKRLQVSAP